MAELQKKTTGKNPSPAKKPTAAQKTAAKKNAKHRKSPVEQAILSCLLITAAILLVILAFRLISGIQKSPEPPKSDDSGTIADIVEDETGEDISKKEEAEKEEEKQEEEKPQPNSLIDTIPDIVLVPAFTVP